MDANHASKRTASSQFAESLNGESIQQQKTDGRIWNKFWISQWPVSEIDIAVDHSLGSLNFESAIMCYFNTNLLSVSFVSTKIEGYLGKHYQ